MTAWLYSLIVYTSPLKAASCRLLSSIYIQRQHVVNWRTYMHRYREKELIYHIHTCFIHLSQVRLGGSTILYYCRNIQIPSLTEDCLNFRNINSQGHFLVNLQSNTKRKQRSTSISLVFESFSVKKINYMASNPYYIYSYISFCNMKPYNVFGK